MIANPCYTLMSPDGLLETPTASELKKAFEKGDESSKMESLKKLLILMSNGHSYPELLMHIIRFILPEKNKTIKKLLLLYFEACEKLGVDGKLKQEMILVCNAIRNDLQHANEFVRGSTLRFLVKLKDVELLEPLIPSMRNCLEHRHSYVRRNAVATIATIATEFPSLIPDASELLSVHLQNESDAHCKSVAVVALTKLNIELAVSYFKQVVNSIETMDEPLQQAFLELIKIHSSVCTSEKTIYLKAILALLSSPSVSNMIKYDCSSLLTDLSTNPVVIKAAANCYIHMILNESNNNVRLIVLDRISELYTSQPQVLQYSLGDLLKALSSSDLSVVKKGLSIIVDHMTMNNVAETVEHLKRELEKTLDDTSDSIIEYRQLLIQALTKCAAMTEDLSRVVVPTLLAFISDKNVPYSMDCIQFLRSSAVKYPQLKSVVVDSLSEAFAKIKSSRNLRTVFWIIGEFSEDIASIVDKIDDYVHQVKESISNADDKTGSNNLVPTTKVLSDGTYATESAAATLVLSKKHHGMKGTFLDQGNIFLPAAIAMTLVKLLARAEQLGMDTAVFNQLKAKSILILVNMLKLIISSSFKDRLNLDSFERISLCLRILSSSSKSATIDFSSFFKGTEESFEQVIAKKTFLNKYSARNFSSVKENETQPDTLLTFSLLKSPQKDALKDDPAQKELSVIQGETACRFEPISKLDKVYALTAISDPIYVEAYIDIQDLSIVMDMIVVNQTHETFQSLCFEFISTGGNRSLFKPTQGTLGGYAFMNLKTEFKIYSAQQIIIHGAVSFDPCTHVPLNFIHFNAIALDITYFLTPADFSDFEFTSLWRILEWENKIQIKTDAKDFKTTVEELCRLTHFKCLSSNVGRDQENDECEVYSANLFSLSKFGKEEVLANVSLEKLNGKIVGHVRIRSKSNGLAYILGNKISQYMNYG